MKKLIVLMVLLCMVLPTSVSAKTDMELDIALTLTFMPPCKSGGTPDYAEWRVRNPNSYPVDYTVLKLGTGQILSGTAPAGYSFFHTPWGEQTLILLFFDFGSSPETGGDSYSGSCGSCDLVKQSYGLAELWGPSGQYATMYIYPDVDGKLPIGIGVGRQQCVLGWTAVRSGYFGFVYKDPCTGEYTWNKKDVTPRSDVLKKGVCARNGSCR